jgi:hypothetical protein
MLFRSMKASNERKGSLKSKKRKNEKGIFDGSHGADVTSKPNGEVGNRER